MKKYIIGMLIISALLSACSNITRRDVATVGGGVGGGLVGHAVGGGTAGTIGGTLGGAYIGNRLAR